MARCRPLVQELARRRIALIMRSNGGVTNGTVMF